MLVMTPFAGVLRVCPRESLAGCLTPFVHTFVWVARLVILSGDDR
jgi:hypothetical protein